MIGDISNKKRYEFILSCLREISVDSSDKINILDLGCGRGNVELFLGEHGFCNITAIDIDPDSIVLARQRCGKYKHLFFEKSVEDFVESTGNAKWDCIICSEVLEHLKQPEDLIKNIRKLLKSSGILSISLSPTLTSITSATSCFWPTTSLTGRENGP